jgi:hypothetical protein
MNTWGIISTCFTPIHGAGSFYVLRFLPADFLTGAQAAAGIAAINSIGNLGGFLGPFLIGWARQTMFVISLRRSRKLSLLQPTTQHQYVS